MKKMICILSALGLLLTAVPAISASAEEKAPLLAGDVNQSGDVNILDMICANKAILGCEELSEEQIRAVDFNHNGEVDSSDSMTLLKYILDIIPGLPSMEQEFTATVTASSSEDAESAVSDAIPGFNKTVQETGAAAADYVITAVPDAEAAMDFETQYAPAWEPEGMMCRTELYDYAETEAEEGQVRKYIRGYTPIKWDAVGYKGDNPEYANYSREYVEALTQPYDLTFEQQTEADFTLTLTGQNAEGSGKEEKTIQSLTINGNPGFCTTLEVQQKDTFTDAAYHLVWKQDGYVMQLYGSDAYSLEDLIRIAESVAPETRVLPSAEKDALNAPEFNIVALNEEFEEIDVTPAENAPTNYDPLYQITYLPENVRVLSAKKYFTYSHGDQDGDICGRNMFYCVMTEEGQRKVQFHVTTQKDFEFCWQIGRITPTSKSERIMVTVSGQPGFCYKYTFEDKDNVTHETYILCWMKDGYMMYMTNNCDFPLDEVIRIAESVTEVQPAD